MKRSLLLVGVLSVMGISLSAQVVPWNCANRSNTNLICLFPVATLSTIPNVQNSPAAAINSTFATQLSQVPTPSPASGIGLLVNAKGQISEYENLGPIMTDRAETIGKHKLFIGFFYQRYRFNSIDGTDLSNLNLVLQAGTTATGGTTYIAENLNINFKLDQYVGVIAFGLTKTTDVWITVPINRVAIGVSSMGSQYSPDGNDTVSQSFQFHQYVSGTSSGIGDVVANVKHTFYPWGNSAQKEENNFKIAGGIFIRFPSGDALNYLGSGAYGFNPYAIFSYQWKVSPHARIGYLWNTQSVLIPNSDGTGSNRLPGGFQYDFGADWSVIKQLTIAGDFFGNQFLNSPYLTPGVTEIPTTVPLTDPNHSCPPNVCDPTQNPATHSYQSNFFSIGGKYRPFANKKNKDGKESPISNLLIYANALIPLNNVGLRSSVVPMVGISYKFHIGPNPPPGGTGH